MYLRGESIGWVLSNKKNKSYVESVKCCNVMQPQCSLIQVDREEIDTS